MNCPHCNYPIHGAHALVDGEPFHLICEEVLRRDAEKVPQQEALPMDDMVSVR